MKTDTFNSELLSEKLDQGAKHSSVIGLSPEEDALLTSTYHRSALPIMLQCLQQLIGKRELHVSINITIDIENGIINRVNS